MPDLELRHPVDRTASVAQGVGVDDIIRTDHEHDVGFFEVVVDILHFEHDFVGDVGFGQKHVHMSWHAPGDGVNSEEDLYAGVAKLACNLAHAVLGLGHRHAVSGYDHYAFCVLEFGRYIGRSHRAYLADLAVRRGDGFSFGSAKAAEDHVPDGAVHGAAHDVAEDGAGASDECARDNEQVVREHETGGCCGPAGVGVQEGDDHGHICATDGHDEVDAENRGDGSVDE